MEFQTSPHNFQDNEVSLTALWFGSSTFLCSSPQTWWLMIFLTIIISSFQERNRNPAPEMYSRKPEPDVPKSERAGNVTSTVKFKNQDFVQLRDHCLNHGVLFQDETFPVNLSSIGPLPFLEKPYRPVIEWRRPTVSSYQVLADFAAFVN